MPSTRIKICGIKTLEHAKLCCDLGVDYIGFIFDDQYRRYITANDAKTIMDHIGKTTSQFVGVFRHNDINDILSTLEKTGISLAQLHHEHFLEQHDQLPKTITTITLCDNDTKASQHGLNNERDFLLIDNPLPGTGTALDRKHEDLSKNAFRYFLAGGINRDNVLNYIHAFNPYAIDVSSGVEDANGNKDSNKIRQFVNTIRGTYE